MKRLASILLLGIALSAVSASATAQDGLWKDRYGRPVPETESRRSLDGLGGWVVVTPDTDWDEKWSTPSVVGPRFKVARNVAKGKQVFVLVFLGNPKTGSDGRADVTCELDVIGPDGRNFLHRSASCLRGDLTGAPNRMYLSRPVLGFVGDASDPTGTWTIQVSLKDNVRGTALPLKTSFILE